MHFMMMDPLQNHGMLVSGCWKHASLDAVAAFKVKGVFVMTYIQGSLQARHTL